MRHIKNVALIAAIAVALIPATVLAKPAAVPAIDGLIYLSDSTPTVSLGATLGAEKVYVGTNSACVILSDQSMRCWGDDSYGQLGDGGEATLSTDISSTPVTVAGGHSWQTADVASGSVCAITTDGDLYCWGANDFGQLGSGVDGSFTSQTSPTRVGTDSDWLAVTGFSDTFCGIRAGGSVWCWGAGGYGTIGDGDNLLRNTPTRVLLSDDVPSINFQAIDAGISLNCGITTSKLLYCWGYDVAGSIGASPSPDTSVTKATQVGTASNWESVGAGNFFACAVNSDKEASCFGQNDLSQLGDGTTDTKPLTPVSGSLRWDDISLGVYHTCGIASTDLYCWGSNYMGQIDWVDSAATYTTPRQVAPDASWSDVDNGDATTCGITEGDVWCWGYNGNGLLSDPDLSLGRSARWVFDGAALPTTSTDGGPSIPLLIAATLLMVAGVYLRASRHGSTSTGALITK